MIKRFKDWKLKNKLLVSFIILMVVPFLFVGYMSLERFSSALKEAAERDLEHIVLNIKEMCQSQYHLMRRKARADLNVAEYVLRSYGPYIDIDDAETVDIEAINQFTKAKKRFRVPVWKIGDQRITLDHDVVDTIQRLVGGTCTILQLVDDGGLLAISTNLLRKSGERATGIYLPPGSPIATAVSSGSHYEGRAFMAGSWYTVACSPLFDKKGRTIGAIYVGEQESEEISLKKAVSEIKVGRTGYAYIIDGEGTLIIHPTKAGQNILHWKDSSGFEFIKQMVTTAAKLGSDEIGTIRYPWLNVELGDKKPRMKLTKYAYFPPWNWIIAAGGYEDEIYRAVKVVRNYLALIGILSLFFAVGMAWFLSRLITKPIRHLTEVTTRMCDGDLNQSAKIEGQDEIGMLARSFNRMAQQVKSNTADLEKVVEKRTEELRESRERYKRLSNFLNNILESATEYSVIATDLEGNIIEYNSGAERMFGWSKREVINRQNIKITLREESIKDGFFEKIARKVMKERMVEIETERTRKGGKVFPVHSVVTVLKDHREETIGLLEVARDISEKRRLERELRDTKDYLENILQSSVDGIVTTDEKGYITYVNKGLEEILGLPKEKLIGTHISKFYLNGIEEARKIMRVLREQGRQTNYQITMVVETDGKRRLIPIMTSNSLLRDENGKIIGTMGIFKDLTEQKKLEEQLKRTQAYLIQAAKMRALGDLVAGVAHELNNPLMASNTVLHVIDKNLPKDDPNRRRFEIIKQCNERITKIVKQLRDFSRQSEQEFISVDINEIVENVLTMTSQQLMNHNVKVVKDLQKGLPRVTGDFNQLEQVFLNLIVNALDAMEGSPEKVLNIRTEKRGDNEIVITVRDTGKGISPEIMDKIFDPFFSTKEVGKGTGLGLSICYQIVEIHGGRIEVESEEGKGAAFMVRLPAVPKGGSHAKEDTSGR